MTTVLLEENIPLANKDFTEEDMQNMPLHSALRFYEDLVVLRVPGGWLYNNVNRQTGGKIVNSVCTFVSEFYGEKPKDLIEGTTPGKMDITEEHY